MTFMKQLNSTLCSWKMGTISTSHVILSANLPVKMGKTKLEKESQTYKKFFVLQSTGRAKQMKVFIWEWVAILETLACAFMIAEIRTLTLASWLTGLVKRRCTTSTVGKVQLNISLAVTSASNMMEKQVSIN